MRKEIWKDIPNYEGLYEASNHGRIRTKEGKTTYSNINVHEDAEAMAEIQEKGFMSLPVVNVDNWEKSWSGFDYQNLNELI